MRDWGPRHLRIVPIDCGCTRGGTEFPDPHCGACEGTGELRPIEGVETTERPSLRVIDGGSRR